MQESQTTERRPVGMTTASAAGCDPVDHVVCDDGAVFFRAWEDGSWTEDHPIPGTRRAREKAEAAASAEEAAEVDPSADRIARAC